MEEQQQNGYCIVCNQSWGTHDDGEHEATMRGGLHDITSARLQQEALEFHVARALKDREIRQILGIKSPDEIEIDKFLELQKQLEMERGKSPGSPAPWVESVEDFLAIGLSIILITCGGCLFWFAFNWVEGWFR